MFRRKNSTTSFNKSTDIQLKLKTPIDNCMQHVYYGTWKQILNYKTFMSPQSEGLSWASPFNPIQFN